MTETFTRKLFQNTLELYWLSDVFYRQCGTTTILFCFESQHTHTHTYTIHGASLSLRHNYQLYMNTEFNLCIYFLGLF